MLAAAWLLAGASAGRDANRAGESTEPNAAQETIGADTNSAEANVIREEKGAAAAESNSGEPNVPEGANNAGAGDKEGVRPKGEPEKSSERGLFEWIGLLLGVPSAAVGVGGLGVWLIHRSKRKYKRALREKLSSIQLSSPDIHGVPVSLLNAFVSLRITEASELDAQRDAHARRAEERVDGHCSPQEIMRRAISNNRRILVILGDAGSGKTTLLSYYAMCCLTWRPRYWGLGYRRTPLPIYFPLREAKFNNEGSPVSLAENLAGYAEQHTLGIAKERFLGWLGHRRLLVLFDGLDEIANLERRRAVCRWIGENANDLKHARFVVTSRWTGYGRKVRVELQADHLEANVQDFSREQQEEFLRKWFAEAFLNDPRNRKKRHRLKWRGEHRRFGLERATKVMAFLEKLENRALKDLARVPMLLHIMAILWKDGASLPRHKTALMEAALKYMLEYKPQQTGFEPLMGAEDAFDVLRPVCLKMQEELGSEDAGREWFHEEIGPKLKSINDRLTPKEFCDNLVERSALLGECGRDAYTFRHKSFREYLAGVQLATVARERQGITGLVAHLGEDWWDEPLRWFMAKADDDMFDGFMDGLFEWEGSGELSQKQQDLLRTLVGEARMVKVDSLVRRLKDGRVSVQKKRYILDCLKVIDRAEARAAVRAYAEAEREAASEAGRYAAEIAAEAEVVVEAAAGPAAVKAVDIFAELPKGFRNSHEYNAEYILIPGGSFKYSVSEKIEPVGDIYFAKYPVTNKRYRRFIRYLEKKEGELLKILARDKFDGRLIEFASGIKGFGEYLDSESKGWAEKLRSDYDTEKRFNDVDQPVVGVSWFDARAYCFWLSELDKAAGRAAGIYRLANEIEWEWAASGGEREYPWPAERGGPTNKLANYGRNVGATTPVGRYPDGATPEGLMDMAGNVWEWMENPHEKRGAARCLRGGSWSGIDNNLRCSFRNSYFPDSRLDVIGFRVVFSQS